ncbi:monocarboxylate transporter 12-B-like [Ixodes scapularis]|uniref:monocarboxylate transporter 12-B-like n=1 Tax=Ixodes scapularis TaxID=6945 RepID=UPI001A9DC2B1|nr:monocarboxylate transporter 12-B-like [Ixodes scapularis]
MAQKKKLLQSLFLYTGIIVVLLQQRVSIARIAIVGSMLLWFGIVASAFATNIQWLYFTYGFIHGGGRGATMIAVNTVLLAYFDKYRGIASGIRYAGATCSGLIFPKLVVFLEREYGFRGMLLIVGAMLINATAFISLLEEPPWFRQPQLKKDKAISKNEGDPGQSQGQSLPTLEGTEKEFQGPYSVLHIIAVFRRPMFFIVALAGLSTVYTQSIFFSTIVDYAMDREMSLDAASSILVYTSLTDFLGAMGLPLLADRKLLRRSTLVMFCYVIVGLSAILYPIVTSVPLFVLVSLLLAMAAATLMTMSTVIAADYLGVEKIPIFLATSGLVSVPLYFWNPRIVGKWWQLKHSYVRVY